MKEVSVYNLKGEASGKVKLNDDIFGVTVRPKVLYQAVVAQQANSREVLAHTKTRGEVRGGGKKPWKQKGTGRARHGSSRSPIWIGGGVTFGPRNNRNFSIKINKKVKRSAITMSLSDKAEKNNIFILENFNLDVKKTKNIYELFQALKLRRKKSGEKKDEGKVQRKEKSILVVLPRENKDLVKVFNNIPRVQTIAPNSLNAVDVAKNEFLLVSRESLKQIGEVFGAKDKKN